MSDIASIFTYFRYLNSGNTRMAVQQKKLSLGVFTLPQLLSIDWDLVGKVVSFLEHMYKDTQRLSSRACLVSEVYPMFRR